MIGHARYLGRLLGFGVNAALGAQPDRQGSGHVQPVRPSVAVPGPLVHFPDPARMAAIDAEWSDDNV